MSELFVNLILSDLIVTQKSNQGNPINIEILT